MPYRRLFAATAILLAAPGLLLTAPVHAAPFISEVYLADAGRAAAIEIDGLTGIDTLSLAVLDARPDSLSAIKSVIQLTGLNQSTLLLTETAWADSPWSVGPPPNQVVSPTAFDFRLQTELLLFEGATTLAVNTALRDVTDNNTASAYAANPAVDALAWAPGGETNATRFAAGTTLNTDDGNIIVRPIVNFAPLLGQPLIGTAEANGTFLAPPYTYVVSPGLSNPSVAALIPEPAPAALLALGLTLLLISRKPRAKRSEAPDAS